MSSRHVLILFCWIFSYAVMAQTSLPDSLRRQLAGIPQDTGYVNRINELGYRYLKSNPELARRISSHALEISPKLKYTQGYARALTNMGSAYWYEGVYEMAQSYYLMAARQYLSLQDSVGLGVVYNNMGEVYKKLGDQRKALAMLLQSVQYKKQEPTPLALTYYNIGELYLTLGDHIKAQEYLEQGLAYAKLSNDKRVIAYSYRGMSVLRTAQHDYEAALAFGVLAERLWLELGEKRSLIQTYQDMTVMYFKQGDFSTAAAYLAKAREEADAIHVPDLRAKTVLLQFRLDSAQKNFEGAIRHLYTYNHIKDSVYNLGKLEQITRLQTIYETEKRERENQVLKSEKELRESQLRFQNFILISISIGLIVTGILAIMLYRQRRRILFVNHQLKEKGDEIHLQKEAIEMQAVALLKLNEELQGLNKNLESRIEQRTAQIVLQNQRLKEFTFLNAHKVRAPLASILGLINLLDYLDSDEQKHVLLQLKSCGEQLDEIIRETGKNLESAIVENRSQES